MTYANAITLQKNIAKKVVAAKDDFGEISSICGVDVAYRGSSNAAYCSAVIMDKNMQQLVESVDVQTIVKYPYVPGLLMLREAEPIFYTLKLLKNSYDLLLIDGHGLLHPRRCGLACYIGVSLDKPTIGVAKSRLCGTVRPDGFVELDGEILGYAISKKLYISVGHRVTLKTAITLVKELGIEPLRLADINSRKNKKKSALD
ncbi:MAG: endonuclease V [Thermoproteota archaeon]|nr:nfi [Nitrososphaera sp.]MDQ4014147.1 endonuclease V [Thermoproteota archaeon]